MDHGLRASAWWSVTVTLRFSGYYRSNSTGWIAASGAAWSYICAAIVIAGTVGGNPQLLVGSLGLLLGSHRLSRVVVSPPTQKKRGRAARTFAFGGTLVGGVIAVAAPRLRRGLQPGAHDGDGLKALENARCWEYDREHQWRW